MSNSSSAGDSLGLSIGRNPKTDSNVSISGFFDVKHRSAITGKITDHSFKNAILRDGVESMLRGLTSSSVATSNGVAATKTGIWLSGIATAVDRGVVATTATFTPLASALTETGDRLYPGAGTALDLSTAIPGFDGTPASQAGTGGVWFRGTGAGSDIFNTVLDVSSLPNVDIVSTALVITAGTVSGIGAMVVDGIFVCNQTNDDADYAANTVLLMSGRTTATGGNASEEFTPAITLNTADTLTITYTLRIAVD